MALFNMQTGGGGGGEPCSVVGGRLEKASATSLQWLPYYYNNIGLYDGANWVVVTPSSTPSLANTANDLDSAALAINSNYDIYAEYSSLTAFNLVAKKWTNDTTRAVTPARFDGVLCYDNSTTNGKKRRFLGSIRMLSSSGAKFEDTSNLRFISNYYNRVPKEVTGSNSTSSWTYDTPTWREFNNGSGQTRGYIILCDAQTTSILVYSLATVYNISCYISPGLDGSYLAVAAFPFTTGIGYGGGISSTIKLTTSLPYTIPIGLHYISQHEYGNTYAYGKSSYAALTQYSDNKVWAIVNL
jgi:hypothetical protein